MSVEVSLKIYSKRSEQNTQAKIRLKTWSLFWLLCMNARTLANPGWFISKTFYEYSAFIHRDALGQIMEIFLLRGIHHPQEQEGMNQRIRWKWSGLNLPSPLNYQKTNTFFAWNMVKNQIIIFEIHGLIKKTKQIVTCIHSLQTHPCDENWVFPV